MEVQVTDLALKYLATMSVYVNLEEDVWTKLQNLCDTYRHDMYNGNFKKKAKTSIDQFWQGRSKTLSGKTDLSL